MPACAGLVTAWSLVLVTLARSADSAFADPWADKSPLQATLEQVLGAGPDVLDEVAVLEAELQSTYDALPKHPGGGVAPNCLRHMVQSYFRSNLLVLIGFEPNSLFSVPQKSPWSASILQRRAPATFLKELEAHTFEDKGATLGEVASYILVLKKFAHHQAMELLECAYHFQNRTISDRLPSDELPEVLINFVVLMNSLKVKDVPDTKKIAVERHELFTKNRAQLKMFREVRSYVESVLGAMTLPGHSRNNPFPRGLHSDEVWRFAERVMIKFRAHQAHQCQNMKQYLMKLDRSGTGRVVLGDFYNEKMQGVYRFTEHEDFLMKLGALDNSVPGSPQVIIPNYVLSSANTISFFGTFGVACRDDCWYVLTHLEREIKGPAAKPKRLLGIVEEITPPIHSQGLGVYRQGPVSDKLREKLYEVAQRYGGEVPLHCRLFWQWLHYVFPLDCPYPQPRVIHPMRELEIMVDKSGMAKEVEMSWHRERAKGAWHLEAPYLSQWSDENVSVLLPDEEPRQLTEKKWRLRLVWRKGSITQMACVAFLSFSMISAVWQCLQAYHQQSKATRLAQELLSDEAGKKGLPAKKKSSPSEAASVRRSPSNGTSRGSPVEKALSGGGRCSRSKAATPSSEPATPGMTAAPKAATPFSKPATPGMTVAPKATSDGHADWKEPSVLDEALAPQHELARSKTAQEPPEPKEPEEPAEPENAEDAWVDEAKFGVLLPEGKPQDLPVALMEEDARLPEDSTEEPEAETAPETHGQVWSLDENSPEDLAAADLLAAWDAAEAEAGEEEVPPEALNILLPEDLFIKRYRGEIIVAEYMGFGFIECAELYKSFQCHVSYSYPEYDCTCDVGDVVEFSIFLNSRGQPQAKDVDEHPAPLPSHRPPPPPSMPPPARPDGHAGKC